MALSSLADILAPIVREIENTRYAELASSVIVIYDHLVTLDQEIELIWKASWTPGKVLFLINRYYVLGSVIFNNYVLFAPYLTDSFCLRWFRWQGCTGLLVSMIAEIILQLRLYALYHLNRRVLLFMCAAFIASLGAAATVMGLVLARVSANANIIPGIPFCLPVNAPPWFYAFWIPTLAFESLLCALALFRAFRDFRSRSSVFQSGRHIVKILVRDSVIYYLVMFATYFTNLVIFLTGNAGVLETGIGFSVSMSCVMGSRLCLNIRDVHHELEVSSHSQHQSHQHLTHQSFVSRSASVGGKGAGRGMNVLVSGSYALTEYEMVELRSLRAQGKV